MSKKLAIVGHATRGREVIRLLKMLGGNEGFSDTGLRLGGTEVCCVYYIGTAGSIIYAHHSVINDDFIVFTLEEFQKKYPFEVGDKVVYTKFGDNCNDYPVTIESMKWTGTTIEYTFNDCVTCLTKDLKMWEEEPKAVISGICLNSCDYADEVELNLGDYEIEVRGNRTYAVKKKSKYPTTFEECLNMLYCKSVLRTIIGHKAELLLNLEKLLICLDAYYKIAGEEMGLGKPWEYNYLKDANTIRYAIYNTGDEIVKLDGKLYRNYILCFPTEEMRDAFYENFKDLIESCKELL